MWLIGLGYQHVNTVYQMDKKEKVGQLHSFTGRYQQCFDGMVAKLASLADVVQRYPTHMGHGARNGPAA